MRRAKPNPTVDAPARAATARGGRRRRGSALVYLTVVMVALLAFTSLAVDFGRVQVARAELQLAADAAARHAARGLETGAAAAEANAIAAAADNRADGSPVVLTDADIEFGTWNNAATPPFTPLPAADRARADAIRVTARRTAARGTAVPLLFARVVGREGCDVHAVSVARYRPDTGYYGLVGINGITLRNNAFVGSYKSSVTTTPTEATASAVGSLYSNGAISAGNGGQLKGNAVLGPAAPAVAGMTVTGSTTRLPSTLAAPPEAAWNPAPNPNGIPQNYTSSGNVTLPGGAYWFTSLTVNGTLTFSGPATLTVKGPVEVNGALRAYQLLPENLKIYQIGNTTFGDAENNTNNMDIVADVSAPNATFIAKNNLMFRGRLIANSIDVKNNADLFYDAELGGENGTKVVTVQ